MQDINLDGAVVAGTKLRGATSRGFTRENLYSTSSYRERDLRGIELDWNDLTDWDFRHQDLSLAKFRSATLAGADLTGAIVAGAEFAFTTKRGFGVSVLTSRTNRLKPALDRGFVET